MGYASTLGGDAFFPEEVEAKLLGRWIEPTVLDWSELAYPHISALAPREDDPCDNGGSLAPDPPASVEDRTSCLP